MRACLFQGSRARANTRSSLLGKKMSINIDVGGVEQVALAEFGSPAGDSW
jgi:hypothetical protein